MTAMPAVAVQGIEELEQEQQSIETELAGLRDKVRTEQSTLARLKGDQAQLVLDIGSKKKKPSEAVALAAEIAGSESVIAGLAGIVKPKQERLYEITELVRKQRGERQRADEIGEVRQLASDAEAILIRAASHLEETVGRELRQFDSLRERLVRINHPPGGIAPGFNRTPAAPTVAANEAIRKLDRLALEKLSPLLRLIGNR